MSFVASPSIYRHPSIRPSVCPSIYLSIHLSVNQASRLASNQNSWAIKQLHHYQSSLFLDLILLTPKSKLTKASPRPDRIVQWELMNYNMSWVMRICMKICYDMRLQYIHCFPISPSFFLSTEDEPEPEWLESGVVLWPIEPLCRRLVATRDPPQHGGSSWSKTQVFQHGKRCLSCARGQRWENPTWTTNIYDYICIYKYNSEDIL